MCRTSNSVRSKTRESNKRMTSGWISCSRWCSCSRSRRFDSLESTEIWSNFFGWIWEVVLHVVNLVDSHLGGTWAKWLFQKNTHLPVRIEWRHSLIYHLNLISLFFAACFFLVSLFSEKKWGTIHCGILPSFNIFQTFYVFINWRHFMMWIQFTEVFFQGQKNYPDPKHPTFSNVSIQLLR